MHTGLRITAFAGAVVATFGAAYGVGAAVGPTGTAERPSAQASHAPDAHRGTHRKPAAAPTAGGREAASAAGGLQLSEGGHTLVLNTPRAVAGAGTRLSFSILDEHGNKVTAYRRTHEKELHLIVASRDLTVFSHLHPTRDADGTWSTTARLPAAGDYRAFADFTPAKKGAGALVLGADLAVSGTYRPAPPPAPSRTAEVDGYRVALAGDLAPGRSNTLTFEVTRNGRPVTDLQPYLGAYGHLVALRSGDLAYLHVHPQGAAPGGTAKAGPEVGFSATAPSSGTYRLFLDFRHEGEVRTAAFTVRAGQGGAGAPPAGPGSAAPPGTPGHGHWDGLPPRR